MESGTDIATSEPGSQQPLERVVKQLQKRLRTGFQVLTGAAAKAVMELMQEPLSRFRNSRRSR